MISKKDIIDEVCKNTSLTKSSVGKAVDEFFACLVTAIKDGKEVRIYELGTFKVFTRKAHLGHNPSTGEAVNVPQKKVPQLKFNRSIGVELNKE